MVPVHKVMQVILEMLIQVIEVFKELKDPQEFRDPGELKVPKGPPEELDRPDTQVHQVPQVPKGLNRPPKDREEPKVHQGFVDLKGHKVWQDTKERLVSLEFQAQPGPEDLKVTKEPTSQSPRFTRPRRTGYRPQEETYPVMASMV